MDDNAVLAQIKAGSHEGLETIYVKYRVEFVAWMAKSYNCSIEDAMDIYQFSVLALYENIVGGKLQKLTSSLKTYLFAIGKNKMMEHKKSTNKIVGHSGHEHMLAEEEYDVDHEALEQDLTLVEHSLEDLGEPCRTILESYYYHKKSMDSIAEEMDYKNADTVKNLKYKCMKRLKKIFEGKTSFTRP